VKAKGVPAGAASAVPCQHQLRRALDCYEGPIVARGGVVRYPLVLLFGFGGHQIKHTQIAHYPAPVFKDVGTPGPLQRCESS
jgi:hypothetical protein